MTHFHRINLGAIATLALATSEAAIAGAITPAPVAGLGVGAVLLLGVGYRILSKRFGG